MPGHRILEVCIASLDDALAAEAGGADRLELNAALELGGLTPPLGLVQLVKESTSLPLIVMNRPRGAGFCYTRRERLQMLRDADILLEHGATGIAAGSLLPNRTIDTEIWHELTKIAGERELVFHRAFDTVSDPFAAAEQLIELGTTRVLTSGGRPTAREGAAQLRLLVDRFGDQIEILAGSGIRPDGIAELVRATHCRQIHGSFSESVDDDGGFVAAAEYRRTSQREVAAARRELLL